LGWICWQEKIKKKFEKLKNIEKEKKKKKKKKAKKKKKKKKQQTRR
jgi:hypothetical protein